MLPTSTDITIAINAKPPADVDAVVAFVTEGADEKMTYSDCVAAD